MAKTAEDRLCAVMTAADSDTIGIEGGADVFVAVAVYDKREHTCLIRRRADEVQAGDVEEKAGGVL